MGLTTWKNAPKGRIRKSDVTVAKNYLNETEMRNLNEIVTMYLDYAERQARRGNVMYIVFWVTSSCNRYPSFRRSAAGRLRWHRQPPQETEKGQPLAPVVPD